MLREKILYLFILSVIVASCSSDDNDPVDVTTPQIDMQEPHNGDSFGAGGSIAFDAIFTDDVELGSYSIDVHDNLDGHQHGRIAQTMNDPSLERWIFKRNYPFPDGSSMYEAQETVGISENAMAGPYHFIVQAVDKAGNATNYQDGSNVENEILITNDSQPVVSITNLVEGELEIEADVRFDVEGDVSDPTVGEYSGMHSMEILLGEDHGDEHEHIHGRITQDDHEFLIDADYVGSELEVFMVDGVILLNLVFESIDFTLSQEQLNEFSNEGVDHLMLYINVFDEQGNLTISKTVVHIHGQM
jgi:hypothetical protein